MKKTLRYAWALAWGMSLGGVASVCQGASLEEYFQQLANAHPRVLAASQSAAAGNAQVEAAKGAWLPQLAGSSSLGKSYSAYYGGSSNGFRPGITATQLLFDGGRTTRNIDARQFDATASEAQHRELLETLSARLLEAYLEWHRQGLLLKLADEQLAALARFEKMVGDIATFDKGRLADLKLVKTRIAQVASAREARAVALHDSVLQLQQICACQLVPDQPPTRLNALLPARYQDQAGEWAQTHPAMLAANARRDSAQADAEVAAAWWKPSIQLQASSQTEPNYVGNPHYFGLNTVALNVQASIFDGNTGRARAQAANAQVNSAESLANATRSELESELRRQGALIDAHQRRLSTLNALVGETDQAFNIVLDQFKLGRRTVIELLSYENERFAARGQVVSEEVDLEQARGRWLAAAGLLTGRLGRQGGSNG